VCVCVCRAWWQWQWEVPPVAVFIVWQFVFVCVIVCVCVCVCVWQNKRSWDSLCGCTWVPPTFRYPKWGITEDAHSHLHNTQEINTFTPPRCSLLLSLPRLMRALLLLAEGLLLTPSRGQMIVFAAWGPEPTSPDLVTGTVDLSTGFPPSVGHRERKRYETASQNPGLS